jgi:hypothetical protein
MPWIAQAGKQDYRGKSARQVMGRRPSLWIEGYGFTETCRPSTIFLSKPTFIFRTRRSNMH